MANNWFESYLSNRKQYISIGDVKSDEQTIPFDFHLFADDSNLFVSHNNLSVLEERVNTHLLNVYE